jgi:hypothetical protein
MGTGYTIYRTDGTSERREASLSPEPGYDALAQLIRPILDGADLEHVSVLHERKRRDMFVDDIGAVKGLPRNEAATAIYRNNWLSRNPGADPESIPAIYGTAILFDRRVWF